MKREAGPSLGPLAGSSCSSAFHALLSLASPFPAGVLAQTTLDTLSKVFKALLFLKLSSLPLLHRRTLSPSYPFSRGEHLNWSPRSCWPMSSLVNSWSHLRNCQPSSPTRDDGADGIGAEFGTSQTWVQSSTMPFTCSMFLVETSISVGLSLLICKSKVIIQPL